MKVTGGVVAVGTAVAMGAVVALGETVVLGGAAALGLGGSPDSPGDLCAGLPQPGPGRLTPSRDLYCLQLVPAAGPIGIEGTLSLLPFRSTFGTAVAPDGRHRFDGVLTLRGLPEPEEFGPYSTYIAWITTPVFTPLIKLGPVENGTNAVGIVDLEKFVVLVSAEASPDVGERTGPLVLRGRSPSTRMRSPDFFEFAMGGRSDHGEHERADGTQPAAVGSSMMLHSVWRFSFLPWKRPPMITSSFTIAAVSGSTG